MDSTSNISDIELTGRIKYGEKEAYRELFERYAPKIYRFSYSYLKNKTDSEELVQDVFMKIWENRGTLDNSKNIKSFIFKIAVNTIYDFIRRENLESVFADYVRSNYESDSNDTWHSIIYDDMVVQLESLVEQMPHQRRIIFKLSREEGLSNNEIAQKLNLSKRTIENQLYRAVAFLKEHFRTDSLIPLLFFYLWCG